MNSEDIVVISNDLRTLINNFTNLKNEVEELKNKIETKESNNTNNNEQSLLKNDIKEIKNLLYSFLNNNYLKTKTYDVEISENRTSKNKTEEIKNVITSTLINDNTDNNNNNNSSDYSSNNINNNNNENYSNNQNNIKNNDNRYNNSENKVTNKNNGNDNNNNNDSNNNNNYNNNNVSRKNFILFILLFVLIIVSTLNKKKKNNENKIIDNNINENFKTLTKQNHDIPINGFDNVDLICDQRIIYLITLNPENRFNVFNLKKDEIYGKSLGTYEETFREDAIKVMKDYKNLLCLDIEKIDLFNVIKACYENTNIDSRVIQSLINKFISIKEKIEKLTVTLSNNNYSYETIDSKYKYHYKNLLDKKKKFYKEIIDRKYHYNIILENLNILRLRYLNPNIKYLLSDKIINNAFEIYTEKDKEFKPIINELLKNYKDHIYDNEYQINGQYSFHLNKNSFL